MIRRFSSGLSAISVALAVLAGCTAQIKQIDAFRLEATGKPEEALARLEEAHAAAPRNIELKRDLITKRERLIDKNLASARSKIEAGDLDEAETSFKKVLKLDPKLSLPRQGLEELGRTRRLDETTREAKKLADEGKTEKALDTLQRVMAETPNAPDAKRLRYKLEAQSAAGLVGIGSLNGLYAKPISLELRDTPIQQAFEALARTTNINFVLDKDVRPDLRATLFLRQTYLEDAVNLLLSTNRLEKKILNEHSVLVYPADPAKTKEYQDLVVRAFYLEHADAKQVASTLKTLLKVREAIPDEKLNMVLMRDTPEAITLAERVIRLHEVPEAEVMLEVEVLEVTRNKLTNLGVQWPAQATLTPISAAGSATLKLADLKNLNQNRIQASVGSATINVNKTDSDVNILANPRIRVRNKTKAKILIGDRVPIITTTAASTGFVSEAVQYVDVGLKLDVEPAVASEDVSIKIGLEVSSLVKEVRSPGGTLAYQIGTRTADTLLKLRDGETQILAGLLNDEERSSGNRIPFIGDVPLLGRLFGTQKDERNKTEIILSITPRIVRASTRPSLDQAQFWSGTETTLRTRPLALPAANKALQASGEIAPDVLPGKQDSAASSVQFSWKAPASVKLGEVTKVALRIKSDGAVRSLPFQIGFDPASVEIVKVEDGGFFNTDTGGASLSHNIDLASGRLFASVMRTAVDGASGDGVAVLMSIRPKSADKPVELRLLGATPIGLSSQIDNTSLPLPLSLPVAP